jgi:probable rRNA maturation factor
MSIEISNDSEINCDESALVSVARFTVKKLGIHVESELSITLVGEPEMTELHLKWLDLPGPTDVLSFPMDEMKPFSASSGPGVIGDIVLCPAYAQSNLSAGHSRTLEAELQLLTVHGVLHLLGYDHAQVQEHEVMFAMQDECLAEWNAQK